MESPEVEVRGRGLELMAGLLYHKCTGFALQKNKNYKKKPEEKIFRLL